MTDNRPAPEALEPPPASYRGSHADPSAPATDGGDWKGGALVGHSVTINKPRDELYAFWRDFRNLPPILKNVERIEVIDDTRSHWVVTAPAGRTVEWDAIVTEDEPGRVIGWKSADGADVPNSGRIEFHDAAPGRGTVVRANFVYDPPVGIIGEWIAKLFAKEPGVQARRDLRKFKQFMETGEVATSASPSGRRSEDPTEQYY